MRDTSKLCICSDSSTRQLMFLHLRRSFLICQPLWRLSATTRRRITGLAGGYRLMFGRSRAVGYHIERALLDEVSVYLDGAHRAVVRKRGRSH